jgi:glycerol-1-phosphate dehydrogenase [NAD(P)+]
MPTAVFCDMSVIAAAPTRLSQSGFGDSLARPTAQADWWLSHLLLGTAYDASLFDALIALEPELHDNARGIALGDANSIAQLMQTLLLSGLGMTLASGSYPASQSEHMIAHTHEMLTAKTPAATPSLHGEDISVTTPHMARYQSQRLKSKRPRLLEHDFPESQLKALFGWQLCEEFKEQYAKKLARMMKNNVADKLESNWEHISDQLQSIHIGAEKIEEILQAAGCPLLPKALGWSDETYRQASEISRFTRDRFTFLDLA